MSLENVEAVLPDAGQYVGVESISAYMREHLEPFERVTWTAEERTSDALRLSRLLAAGGAPGRITASTQRTS